MWDLLVTVIMRFVASLGIDFDVALLLGERRDGCVMLEALPR